MGKHTINWNNYPPIEECTDMGDTNGNRLDIGIEDIKGIFAECHNMDFSCSKHLHQRPQLTTNQNIYDI